MLDEFKAFIARGNVLDLAVGVIIGGAFGTIVSSLTGDVIMPLLSLLTGSADFTENYIRLGPIPAEPPLSMVWHEAHFLNWASPLAMSAEAR